jgi:hypothetical protein
METSRKEQRKAGRLQEIVKRVDDEQKVLRPTLGRLGGGRLALNGYNY